MMARSARKGTRAKARKSDAWFAFYIGDYLGDTMSLTTRQHGAYCLLLMAAYRAGGSLPTDAAELMQITRLAPEQWDEDWARVSRYFYQGEGELRHRRVDRELAKVAGLSEARSAAGQSGAAGRWEDGGAGDGKGDGKPHGKAMANGMANQGENAWQSDGKPAPSQSPSQPQSEGLSHHEGASLAAAGTEQGDAVDGGLVGWILTLFSNPNLLRSDAVRAWRDLGASEALIRDVLSSVTAQQRMAKPDWKPSSLRYFTDAIKRAIETRRADEQAAERQINESWRTWEPRLRGYQGSGFWLEEWDEKPDAPTPNPAIPRALLIRFGFKKEAA